jgi:hypothetical protein
MQKYQTRGFEITGPKIPADHQRGRVAAQRGLSLRLRDIYQIELCMMTLQPPRDESKHLRTLTSGREIEFKKEIIDLLRNHFGFRSIANGSDQ